jgi:hypothetical protein
MVFLNLTDERYLMDLQKVQLSDYNLAGIPVYPTPGMLTLPPDLLLDRVSALKQCTGRLFNSSVLNFSK